MNIVSFVIFILNHALSLQIYLSAINYLGLHETRL